MPQYKHLHLHYGDDGLALRPCDLPYLNTHRAHVYKASKTAAKSPTVEGHFIYSALSARNQWIDVKQGMEKEWRDSGISVEPEQVQESHLLHFHSSDMNGNFICVHGQLHEKCSLLPPLALDDIEPGTKNDCLSNGSRSSPISVDPVSPEGNDGLDSHSSLVDEPSPAG